jgi:predicted transcriptional regulator
VEDKVDEYLADALEIVKAQASVRIMGEDEIASMLRKLADSLRGIDIGSTDPVEDRQLDAVTARNSIREKSVTCLECGQVFKILSSKHLASHGLAPTSYKEKYGIKPKTALAAKYLVRMRKKKMEEMKLWEKRQLHQEIRTGTS